MRGARRVAVFEWIGALRVGREHELHALQVGRRVAEVARQVDAADPLGAWRDADPATPDGCAGRMRAMPADIGWRARRVPGVEPVIVVLSISPTIAIAQRRVVALHAAVGLADDDALAGHAQLVPDAIGADHMNVP